jgi:hypothetical protein
MLHALYLGYFLHVRLMHGAFLQMLRWFSGRRAGCAMTSAFVCTLNASGALERTVAYAECTVVQCMLLLRCVCSGLVCTVFLECAVLCFLLEFLGLCAHFKCI